MAGVAADIGHINTKSVVTGYQPDADGLKQALTGAEIVLIPAGVPRKPGMTRDGTAIFLFSTHTLAVLPEHLLIRTAYRPLQHQRLDRSGPRESRLRRRPRRQRSRHCKPCQ